MQLLVMPCSPATEPEGLDFALHAFVHSGSELPVRVSVSVE